MVLQGCTGALCISRSSHMVPKLWAFSSHLVAGSLENRWLDGPVSRSVVESNEPGANTPPPLPAVLAQRLGHRVGGIVGSFPHIPSSCLGICFLSACSQRCLPLSFFLCTLSSLQQPHHYCRFIFRVKATELQIRQGLKRIDKRKVFVFEVHE